MATVRFSQELKDAILSSAKATFSNQINAAQVFSPESVTGDEIYFAAFGAYATIMEQLPQIYFEAQSEVRIRRVGGISIDKSFPFTEHRRWPYNVGKLNRILRPTELYGGGFNTTDDPFWQNLHAEAKAWNDKRIAIIKRRDEFVDSVKRVIEAHITLAPALKMWPPLWDLIPENYRNRHRQVVERTKQEVEVNVDLNRLTALATQAKFQR